MPFLPDSVYIQIQALCAEGDRLAETGALPAALDLYWQAWDVLPSPPTNGEAATWILGAIGDANFRSGDFIAGRDNLSVALRCPDALGNAFLHMRLGQCHFELGNLDQAADHLARGYLAADKQLFDDEDPKYFAFLQTRLKRLVGGW